MLRFISFILKFCVFRIMLKYFDWYFGRSVEDVKQIFKIATAMVKSGRIDLVRAVRPMLCKLKESKSLDWKVCTCRLMLFQCSRK